MVDWLTHALTKRLTNHAHLQCAHRPEQRHGRQEVAEVELQQYTGAVLEGQLA